MAILDIFKKLEIHQVFIKKEQESPYKFAEAKLKDGTTIMYEGDTPMMGMPLLVVTPEGNLPAPAGKHEMEDGTILVVEGNEGLITEVIPAGTTEEDPALSPEEEAAKAAEAQKAEDERLAKEEITRTVEETVKKYSAEIEEKMNSKLSAMAEEVNKSNDVILKLFNLVEQFGEQPKDQPAKGTTNPLFKKKDEVNAAEEAIKLRKTLEKK